MITHEELDALLTPSETLSLAAILLTTSAPGKVTHIARSEDHLEIESSVLSPFTDRSPSTWLTVVDVRTGRVVSSTCIAQSVQL